MSRLAQVPVAALEMGPNVRSKADAGLADSVREHGVLSPITVCEPRRGRYRVLLGHRRALAARLAGLESVPAVVVEGAGDRVVLQLVENIHRRDLDALDRSRAILRLVEDGLTQAEVARRLGVAASTVANDLRLLDVDPEVREALAAGRISRSHAKAVASLPPERQRQIAGMRVSSHEAERLASRAPRSVSLRLGPATADIGVERRRGGARGPYQVVSLVLHDGQHGLMLDLAPDHASLLGRRLLQAGAAALSSGAER